MTRVLGALFLVLTVILLAGGWNALSREGVWEEIWVRANQDYREGRFQEAVEGYGRLVQGGVATGQVYYNLGNAWFKMEQLGRAILSYERARLSIPRDRDLRFNLSRARDQAVDAIPEQQGFLNAALFWLEYVTLSEIAFVFVLLNALLWGVLLCRLFWRPEWAFHLLVLLLPCWLISGASFGAKWVGVHHDDRAVILVEAVDVLAGPHSGDTVLFKLHEGAMVFYERDEEGWALIRLGDGKRGWIPSGAMERVKPSITARASIPMTERLGGGSLAFAITAGTPERKGGTAP